jgi:hypothetical protein
VLLIELLLVSEDETTADELDRVEELEEDVDEIPLVVDTREESLYNSNLFPAPQYCTELPGQMKLQSLRAARTDPAPSELPQ